MVLELGSGVVDAEFEGRQILSAWLGRGLKGADERFHEVAEVRE